MVRTSQKLSSDQTNCLFWGFFVDRTSFLVQNIFIGCSDQRKCSDPQKWPKKAFFFGPKMFFGKFGPIFSEFFGHSKKKENLNMFGPQKKPQKRHFFDPKIFFGKFGPILWPFFAKTLLKAVWIICRVFFVSFFAVLVCWIIPKNRFGSLFATS